MCISSIQSKDPKTTMGSVNSSYNDEATNIKIISAQLAQQRVDLKKQTKRAELAELATKRAEKHNERNEKWIRNRLDQEQQQIMEERERQTLEWQNEIASVGAF